MSLGKETSPSEPEGEDAVRSEYAMGEEHEPAPLSEARMEKASARRDEHSQFSLMKGLKDILRNPFKMRDRTTLGIDIGTHSIKMILARKRGKTVASLSARIVRRAEEGHGEKDNFNDIVPLIKESVREFKGEINNVVMVIQGPAAIVRRVEVPPMPKGELKTAIPWVINKFLPYSIEDAVFDYEIIGERTGTGELELIVAVAEKEWVNHLISQVRKIGLPPSIVTVAPYALGNLMREVDWEEGDMNVVVNIGEQVTNICFFSPKRLEFSRDIRTAGGAITSSLTGKVSYKGEEFSIDPETAERLKCRYGIPMGEMPEFSDMEIPFSSIQALLRPSVERLATEIDRSIKYAARTYGIHDIHRVMLTGGSANLVNLPEYLTSTLGRPVETFNPGLDLDGVRCILDEGSQAVFQKFGLSLSVALGLVMERGDSLNLISSGVHDIRQAVLERKILKTAAGLLILVLAGTSINMEVKRRIDLLELAGANMSWNSIRDDPSYQDVQTIRGRVGMEEKLLSKFNASHDITPLLLKDISHRIPEGVILDDLTLKMVKAVSDSTKGSEDPEVATDEGSEAGGGSEDVSREKPSNKTSGWILEIGGIITTPRAFAEPLLSNIMMDLSLSPFLGRTDLTSLDEANELGLSGMEFLIRCDVIRPPFEEVGAQ
jgi:type IV pilus assembly protein PilM